MRLLGEETEQEEQEACTPPALHRKQKPQGSRGSKTWCREIIIREAEGVKGAKVAEEETNGAGGSGIRGCRKNKVTVNNNKRKKNTKRPAVLLLLLPLI